MKIFNLKIQKNIIIGVFLLFIAINILYYLTPLTQGNVNSTLNSIRLFFILLSIFLLIIRNQIKIFSLALILSILLSINGIINLIYDDNLIGFFFGILSFFIASYTQNQIRAYIVWLSTIFLFYIIGLLRLFEIIQLPAILHVKNYNWRLLIEQYAIYTILSGIITASISSLRKFIIQIFDDAKQERTKYKPLFDQTHSFITILDDKGIVVESNQAALYFIQKTNEKVIGRFFPDTEWWNGSQDSKMLLLKNLESAMSGDFRRFETTHVSVDGDLHYFDYTLKPIFDNNYHITNIIAEARNISLIKNAKQALIEGEERLVALSESTYEGIIISDRGKAIEVNTAIQTMLRIEDINELIGKYIIDFIHPDEKTRVTEYLKSTSTKTFETRAICNDNTVIPIEIESRDIDYQGRRHRVSAVRNLTERKLAQEALVVSEEKYRLMTENINDIICKFNEKIEFTYISSSVFNMLGYTVNEFENLRLNAVTTKESFKKIISSINSKKAQLKANDQRAWNEVSLEAILKHKNGQLIWTNISAKLVKWGKNRDYEILCVARNIDALKKIQFSLEENERRLKLQNEEYERLNTELIGVNEKLLESKTKAEESDKLKSAFLANMSHEIRTPMNSIIGFSKMFKTNGTDEEKRKKYADFVINNGIQLLNIVNDILDLSKIESNQIRLKESSFNLNHLFDALYVDTCKDNNKGLLISLTKDLTDEESFIITDSNRLKQVLRNLINNAYKFTKKGGIKFGYNILNDKIIFFVEDTGIGIASEQQDKIFERFRQVELDASRVFGGAGLGLSISKKMVELMQGRIWLKSEAGTGSTFYVSIPFKRSNSSDLSKIESSRKAKKAIKTILVAEDDDSNFLYLDELFSGRDLNVLRAKNGIEAVKMAISNSNIELVFMDIKMPIMDGLEATKRIKKIKPNLPIIAQTAFAMSDDKEIAIQSGCDDYMSKPINQQLLFSFLSKYLHE